MRHLKNVFQRFLTPQSQPMPDRPEQVPNTAGGFAWQADEWTRLERFLVLGSEGGTYYIAERELTLENAEALRECLRKDGQRTVRLIVEISRSGRAPKNDPALFALAMASSPKFAEANTNAAALAALPEVARTGTHLFHFVAFAGDFRGWGRGLRNAVARWYEDTPLEKLEYQMLKYQNRDDWRHRDLMRLAHPKPATENRNSLFRWALGRDDAELDRSGLWQVEAFEQAKRAKSEDEVASLVREFRLTQEMVPPQWKNSSKVWEALLEEIPYTALLRHLGKLTSVGLLTPNLQAASDVAKRLTDPERVRRSRVHPIAILAALLTYKQGRGFRGELRWAPAGGVIDALDEAFYLAFTNVEPSNQRIYVALDASGSMQGAAVNGMPFLTAAMGSAAMAMAVARSEPKAFIAAFHERVWHVDITAQDRLDRACDAIARKGLATDASLPMKDALDRKLKVDAFVIYTDNETWAGDRHPVQALDRYRQSTGIPAKMVVVAMAANRYSIADPRDPRQLDVAGFDTTVPSVIAGFVRA
ncbi:MAG: TROVE domain-containing protein [Bryobacteraceae bacterium]